LTEIAILLDNKNKKYLKKIEPVHIEENLAMITLKTPPEMVEVVGFVYYLLGLLSNEGINLIDLISTFTELNFVVKEEDGAETYNVLYSSIKDARKTMIT
jgi:aspartokinase